MAEIRLEEVSRVYAARAWADQRAGGQRTNWARGSGQADRAFAERLAAQDSSTERSTDLQGEVVALDRVMLTIADGETLAVVGPSGCGKSTLLRVVAGLDTEYTGDIYYDGQDVREIPVKDRLIGMVFQNYALYPHFPGEGNLSFFFRMHKAPDTEAEARIKATAEIMGFGFKQLLDRKPGTLSGGQQQRLAIARALVREPRLFLFDEPLSNLDAKLRMQTRIEIKRLLRRFGITAIYVTHDQEEATALGDRIAVMREGRVEQVGLYSELRATPCNAFVAGFLGRPPMNLAEGLVEPDGTLRLEDGGVPLPPRLFARYGAGRRLTVGVRAEAAWVGHAGEPGPEGARLTGTVEMLEPDFARHTQYVRVGLGQPAVVTTNAPVLTVLGPLDQAMRIGETVNVVLPPGDLYFFDAETGERIIQ
jgi:ABC-type sugar transport system ATPase subunit